MQTERLSQASKDANGATPKAALTPSENEQQIGDIPFEKFFVHLAGLTVSKRPGTSCQIEIHFAVVNHLYLFFCL